MKLKLLKVEENFLAEYLQLKNQAQNAHKQREAYNRAGLRARFGGLRRVTNPRPAQTL